jgi:hypothetical protein
MLRLAGDVIQHGLDIALGFLLHASFIVATVQSAVAG